MLTQPRESKMQRGVESTPKEKERSAEEEERRAKKQFFKRAHRQLLHPLLHRAPAPAPRIFSSPLVADQIVIYTQL